MYEPLPLQFKSALLTSDANCALLQAIDMRIYDISLSLSCVIMLMSPAAADRLPLLTEIQANQLFAVICRFLSGILRRHRTKLIETIPSFAAIIKAFFHCFKSPHPAIAVKQ